MQNGVDVIGSGSGDSGDRRYVIAVDIGTTAIKTCLFDENACPTWSTEAAVNVIYRLDGDKLLVEIEPEDLWTQFCQLVKKAVRQAGGPNSIVTCGISMQRNTLISWDKRNNKPCHNLIVWKDARSKDECIAWNKSWTIRLLHALGSVGHFFTHSARFKAAMMYKFLGSMVILRFLVTLQSNPSMQEVARSGNLQMGCLDTWLISRLTKGEMYASECSCASSTGLFDPYIKDWGRLLLRFVHPDFPADILPEIVDTAQYRKPLLVADNSIFGFPLRIGAMVGDQSASVFAAGLRQRGEVKISLGTGAFVDLITGSEPHASMYGLYPVVGWRIGGVPLFLAEGKSDDTATLVSWLRDMDLIDSVESLSSVAESVLDTDDVVFFVPAFNGIQTPVNNDDACAAFLGLRPDTNKAQMVRAVLEAIAFRIKQIWSTLVHEADYPVGKTVRICGGVARNDFVCQTIATLINKPVERLADVQLTSALGAALLAGISAGLWSPEKTAELARIEHTFQPQRERRRHILAKFDGWKRAVDRCLNFYTSSSSS